MPTAGASVNTTKLKKLVSQPKQPLGIIFYKELYILKHFRN